MREALLTDTRSAVNDEGDVCSVDDLPEDGGWDSIIDLGAEAAIDELADDETTPGDRGSVTTGEDVASLRQRYDDAYDAIYDMAQKTGWSIDLAALEHGFTSEELSILRDTALVQPSEGVSEVGKKGGRGRRRRESVSASFLAGVIDTAQREAEASLGRSLTDNEMVTIAGNVERQYRLGSKS